MGFLYLFVIFEVFFLNVVLLGQGQSDWKLVKNCNNIKAYVQKVPTSQIRKVKVETVLVATLSELVALIKDAENHNDWVFLNEKAKLIEEQDDFNWKYYGYTDAPWPVSDRDFITDVTLRQDKMDCSVTILSVALPDFLPEEEDCVRIPFIRSVWTLNPIGNGSVHISLEIEVDIGGKIPVWLTNLAKTMGPLNTMNGLIKMLKTNKYKGVKIDYIEEFGACKQ